MTEELLSIADRIVGWSRDGEQVEAVVVHDRETEVRVYKGEVESFTAAESHGVGIRVISNNRQGIAHAGTLDIDVLEETLAEARDNAEFGSPDPFFGMVEPDGVPIPELDLYDPAVGAFPTRDKIDLAVELERSVLDADARIVGVESAEYVDSVASAALVSSSGIRHSGHESGCYLAVYSLAAEGSDTQTGFGFSVSRSPESLDFQRAAADSVDRATRLLGAKKPKSDRLTMVFDPFVTAQLLGVVGGTLSAEVVLKGRSLFADRLGEQVGAACLTLIDDPTDIEAFTATDTDGEGLASRRNVLIDDGKLDHFLHNSYTGRRMDTSSTASAVRGYSSTPSVGAHALSLKPGSRLQSELIASVGDGVLIQGVSGLHSGVNAVSGDFSVGAEGLRIRGGELAEPIREATIASTLQRMLLDVSEVGADLERLPMSASGVSLVVSDIMLSGA